MKKLPEQSLLLIEIKNSISGKETLVSKDDLLRFFKSTYFFGRAMMEIDFTFFYYGVLGKLTGRALEETRKNANMLTGWHLADARKFSYSFPELGMGMRYMEKKEYGKAIEKFKEGLEIYQENFGIWENMIRTFQLKGDQKRARKYTKKLKSLLKKTKGEIIQKSQHEWEYSEAKKLLPEAHKNIKSLYQKYKKIFSEEKGILGQLYLILEEIGNVFEGKKSNLENFNVNKVMDDILERYLVWISILATISSQTINVSEHSFNSNHELSQMIIETLGWTPKSLTKAHFLNSPRFYSPELRKESWKKLFGTDVFSLTPMKSINEAFYHSMDNSDNPDSHMWISNQMEEMKISEEIIEDHIAHKDTNLGLIEEHIESYLGEIGNVIHDKTNFEVHTDIFIIPPTKERNYYFLVTSGMSEKPMHAPSNSWKWWGLDFDRMGVPEKERGIFELRFAELMIKLPPDWPVPQGKIEKNEYSWPFEELIHLTRYVHSNNEWFWVNHTMRGESGGGFAKNTDLNGWLFTFPMGNIPQAFNSIKVNKHKAIFFLQLVPLYQEEIQYAIKNGTKALVQLFRKNNVPDYIALNRINVCK